MWFISTIYVVPLVVLAIFHWIYKWRNPKYDNGRLPPGSMGLPLIGETIQFFIPSKSIDMPLFVKKRIKKYGPVFKTSLAGRPVVISADAEASHYILQQEGKLVEMWYMDSLAKLLGHSESLKPVMSPGQTHKYVKKTLSEHLGPEVLKAKLLPEMEEMAQSALLAWAKHKSVEVRHACAEMSMDFTAKVLFGYSPEKFGENLTEIFEKFIHGLMSLPLNIPGTAFHGCLQSRKKMMKILSDTIEERRAKPETRRGDFLDSVIEDMKAEKLITEDLGVYVIFALMLATSETLPSTITMAIKLLSENPLALQELVKEHEDIVRSRESTQAGITWKEYKSMSFTMNVINEALRMGGSAGMLRRVIGDININGYTIPKGWAIAVIPPALHMDPLAYKDPLTFNPWRWKDLGSTASSKNFVAFGGGMRTCSGAEYSKALMAVFLHVLVTNYRWSSVKGGEIVRSPTLGFGNGYYIKVESLEKQMIMQ